MASDNNPFTHSYPPPPPPPFVVPPLNSRAPDGSSIIVTASAPVTFSHTLSEKLDDKNFLLWRQQVEPVIKAHRLHHYVVCPTIPPRFLTEADRDSGNVNSAYTAWEQQDQMLLSWLQSSLSSSILARVLGSVHSYEVWEKIHSYFQHQTRAKARQLRTELRHLSLDDMSVEDFLAKVKSIVDSLASVRDPVSPKEHLDVILEGLTQEYDSVINVIEREFIPMPIEQAEALILAQELRLKKYRKAASSSAATINLTETAKTQNQSINAQAQANVVEDQNQDSQQFSGFRGSNSDRGGRFGCG